MTSKIVIAVVTVLIGIGAALALYWLLNKLAELLPDKVEHKLKPFLYILPAYFAIGVFLIYPTIQSVINSFKDQSSTEWVGLENYTELLTSKGFQQTIFNTLLWMLIVPIVSVIIGLAVAVLADRLKPGSEKLSKTIIFLPMAVSAIGAAIVWSFIYETRPASQPQIGLLNAVWTTLGGDPVAWLEQSQLHLNSLLPVSYTHLTLPTTPYV